MCSLDQPAPEVVAQVDAGVCGLGFAGGARRLGWLDAREVACAVVVVALDLAVGQFAGHDAPLGQRQRHQRDGQGRIVADRKSTRLNSSHLVISYAVFCLKKKKAPLYSSMSRSSVHCSFSACFLFGYTRYLLAFRLYMLLIIKILLDDGYRRSAYAAVQIR